MIGIYLGAYLANHPNYNIVYQDINGKRDIGGDMMEIDLKDYDFIIATPPCNYYSRANYRRNVSDYSLKTRHLLPGILKKLCSLNKPFIVENVRNAKMFNELGLFNLPCNVYFIGRHTYWSNIYIPFPDFNQHPIIEYKNGKKLYLSSQNLPSCKRQGTFEVHEVIEYFISFVSKNILY